MSYNFSEISDHDLKLFFAVMNDLHHKANLMGATELTWSFEFAQSKQKHSIALEYFCLERAME